MYQVRPFQNQQLNQMEIVVGTYESSETIAKPIVKSNERMSRSIWTKWDPFKTNS